MNCKQVEEWECPNCGKAIESIYPCNLCKLIKNNEPLDLGLWMSDDNKEEKQPMPRGIMFYSIFKKNDPRKGWGGYKFWFYSGEFVPPINKHLSELHIHVIADRGDIRVYLNNDLTMEEKYRGIPEHKWGEIRSFVKKHYNYIIERVENKLRESGIIK